MLSYYNELVNKSVTPPPNDIFVVDNQYILLKPKVFTLFVKQNLLSGQSYIIKDGNNKDCFKCKEESNKKIITNLNDEPLLIIKDGDSSSYMRIFSGNNEKKVIATINIKNSTDPEKYTVTYFNQASEKNEILNMKCDGTYRSCGIFYEKENEKSSLICKIFEMKSNTSIFNIVNNKTNYTIEIASGVDSLLMVALSICLTEMKNQYLMDLNDD